MTFKASRKEGSRRLEHRRLRGQPRKPRERLDNCLSCLSAKVTSEPSWSPASEGVDLRFTVAENACAQSHPVPRYLRVAPPEGVGGKQRRERGQKKKLNQPTPLQTHNPTGGVFAFELHDYITQQKNHLPCPRLLGSSATTSLRYRTPRRLRLTPISNLQQRQWPRPPRRSAPRPAQRTRRPARPPRAPPLQQLCPLRS